MQSEHKNETEGNFTIKQCNENKNHRTVICTTNNYNANCTYNYFSKVLYFLLF